MTVFENDFNHYQIQLLIWKVASISINFDF